MTNDNCHSFERYSKTFEPLQTRCSCGGSYDCVNLSKSDRDNLTLMCSNPVCPSVTIAHRKGKGLAFDGADLPRATL